MAVYHTPALPGAVVPASTSTSSVDPLASSFSSATSIVSVARRRSVSSLLLQQRSSSEESGDSILSGFEDEGAE